MTHDSPEYSLDRQKNEHDRAESKLVDFMAYRARLARAKLDAEEPRAAVARNMDAWDAFRALACTRNPLPDGVCQHGVNMLKSGCRQCEHGSEL